MCVCVCVCVCDYITLTTFVNGIFKLLSRPVGCFYDFITAHFLDWSFVTLYFKQSSSSFGSSPNLQCRSEICLSARPKLAN